MSPVLHPEVPLLRTPSLPAIVGLGFLAGCSASGERNAVTCGLAALTAPFEAQQAFGRGQALAEAPWNPEDSLPVRMVAGPLYQAYVTEEKTGWRVEVRDTLPTGARSGHAVLVTDGKGNNRGILLYDGAVIRGAPVIGTFAIADTTFPLIGVRLSSASLDDAVCPIFGPRPSR